ncbi:Gibberellin-regulated protein 14 [Linum perenne]
MASSRFILVAVLLILCMTLDSSEGKDRFLSSVDCGPKCNARCSKHSRPNVCVRACTTCCYRCSCVPPGTYGNRELCGRCYTDMTTHGKRLKCP